VLNGTKNVQTIQHNHINSHNNTNGQIEKVTTTTLSENNTNPNTPSNNKIDDDRYHIIGKLEDLCKKYKSIMEPEDNADFENIVEMLKANLSD
jgi:hypothetical protein